MFTLSDDRLTNEGFDLFCRAIGQRDADAWAEIAVRYRSLLVSWARRALARSSVTEHAEDIADHALARAWMALSSAQSCAFPSLAAVLGYLRVCVSAVVIDMARAQAARIRLQAQIGPEPTANPEQEVIDGMSHGEVWRVAMEAIGSEQERVVLHDSIVLDLPSRIILQRHPKLFDCIEDVYRARRNLFSRLQRHPELRRIYEGGA